MKSAVFALVVLAAILSACAEEEAPQAAPQRGQRIDGIPGPGTPSDGVATPAPGPASTGTAALPAPPAPAKAERTGGDGIPAASGASVPGVKDESSLERISAAATPPVPELGDPGKAAAPTDDPMVQAQLRVVEAKRLVLEEKANSEKAAPEKPQDGKTDGKTDGKAKAPKQVDFDVLGGFAYVAPEADKPETIEKSIASIPADVRALDGETVEVIGFMIPMQYSETDDGVTSFLVSRFQMGCCFGVVPKANELVEVTMPAGKSAPYTSWAPIRVTGVLRVGLPEGEVTPMSGIYRIDEPGEVDIVVDDQPLEGHDAK